MDFTCIYRPLSVRSLIGNQNVSTSNEPTSQFTLLIEKTHGDEHDVIFQGVTSEENFNLRVRDVAFLYAENIALNANGRTIPCSGAEMVYDVGLSKKKRLILTFQITESDLANSGSVQMTLDDKVFTMNVIAFQFTTHEIGHMPELQL